MGLFDDDLERVSDESCILRELVRKSGLARIIYDAFGPEHIRMEIGNINDYQPKHLYGFCYKYDSSDVVIKLLDHKTIASYSIYSLHISLNDII